MIPGLESVAAPVVRGGPDGTVVASVAVVFLAGSADLTELGALVTETAAAVRAALD